MQLLHVDYCSELADNSHFIKMYIEGDVVKLSLFQSAIVNKYAKSKRVKVDYSNSFYTVIPIEQIHLKKSTALMIDLIVKDKDPYKAIMNISVDTICEINKIENHGI